MENDYIRIYINIVVVIAVDFAITIQPQQKPLVHIPIPQMTDSEPKKPIDTPLATVAKIETPAPIQQKETPSTQPIIVAATGNKESWMSAAGIPQSDWQYVDYIVGRESGWNPCAYNPSQSDCNANPTSACGLAQSLPCGKQSKYGHWTDPVANLKWQYEYVTERYGGYAQAYAFWLANKWY